MNREKVIDVTGFSEKELDEYVNEAYTILTRLNYPITKEWLEYSMEIGILAKEDKIRKMREMPEYIGNLRCAVSIELDRDPAKNLWQIRNFCDDFLSKSKADDLILSKKNAEGKTATDCLKEHIDKMGDMVTVSKLTELKPFNTSDEFDYQGYYLPSKEKLSKFRRCIGVFRNYSLQNVDEDLASNINRRITLKHPITAGMKTGRAFNKVCEHFGFNEKNTNYVRLRNQYGDLVSGKKQVYKYIISANWIDFLLGSEGNTWKSCHTIDPNNKLKISSRYGNEYGGMHRLGNISYATDSATLITFCIDRNAKKEDITMQPKVFRMHCHYEDGAMVQGRIYPQDNDGGGMDIYKIFRLKIQKFVCDMVGVPYVDSGEGNDTWIYKGNAQEYARYISSRGHQYPDYFEYHFPKFCYMRGTTLEDNHIHIGNQETCLCCGRQISYGYMLTCRNGCDNN